MPVGFFNAHPEHLVPADPPVSDQSDELTLMSQ